MTKLVLSHLKERCCIPHVAGAPVATPVPVTHLHIQSPVLVKSGSVHSCSTSVQVWSLSMHSLKAVVRVVCGEELSEI